MPSDQLHAIERRAHDFAEALDLAFRLEVDEDRHPARSPFRQTRRELRTLRFHEHEIANRKFRHVSILKGARIIFLRAAFLQPAFADDDLRVVLLLRFERDAEMILRDVIAHLAALFLGRAEQEIDRRQMANGSLRVEIELAERFDFVIEEFRAHRQLRLPGKEIENAAAHGELAARGHLRHALVAAAEERLQQRLHRLARALFDAQRGRRQRALFRRRLREAGAGRDHEMRPRFPRDPAEQREPFRRDLRIGQNILDRRELRFREEERPRHPVQQALVENLLRAHRRADHPKRAPGCASQRGHEKRLGRRRDVRKTNRPDARRDRAQLARDRLRACDTFRQL